MKYCSHCGAQIMDEAVICVHCGCSVAPQTRQTVAKDDTLDTLIKVFLVIGCVSVGWALFPLLWCIPITVSIFNKLKSGEAIGTGLKVCALIFVNLIAGICLLCRED